MEEEGKGEEKVRVGKTKKIGKVKWKGRGCSGEGAGEGRER